MRLRFEGVSGGKSQDKAADGCGARAESPTTATRTSRRVPGGGTLAAGDAINASKQRLEPLDIGGGQREARKGCGVFFQVREVAGSAEDHVRAGLVAAEAVGRVRDALSGAAADEETQGVVRVEGVGVQGAAVDEL